MSWVSVRLAACTVWLYHLAVATFHFGKDKRQTIFGSTKFRRVRRLTKSDYYVHYVCVHLSVCRSAWNDSVASGMLFVKVDI